MGIQDDVDNFLAQRRKAPRIVPKDYQEFMPSAIPLAPRRQDSSFQKEAVSNIGSRSQAATQEVAIRQQNKRDYNAMLEAERKLAEAKKVLGATKRPKMVVPVGQPQFTTKVNPVPVPVAKGSKKQQPQQPVRGSVVDTGSKSWQDSTPFKGASVGGGLTTVNWRGHSLTVNAAMANNFIGFLNALAATGYKINTIGSYANRGNTSNPSVKSMHAYGLAIDINPSANPYGSSLVTDMPNGVGRLAAKYGLQWGGNWNSVKDAMHFSLRGGYGGSAG